MDKIKLSIAIIDALGGPSAVARIFHMERASIRYWAKAGIPPNRLGQLRDLFPKVVKRVEAELAASQGQDSALQ